MTTSDEHSSISLTNRANIPLAAYPFIFVIQLYRLLLSPLLGSNCRFYPSCSQYAIDALSTFGILKGIWVSAKRLGKCHPWHPGGYDPVR